MVELSITTRKFARRQCPYIIARSLRKFSCYAAAKRWARSEMHAFHLSERNFDEIASNAFSTFLPRRGNVSVRLMSSSFAHLLAHYCHLTDDRETERAGLIAGPCNKGNATP